MKITNTIAVRIATITGLALGAFALSAFATDWSAPLAAPYTCVSGNPGCDAPIHVGTALQEKMGPFKAHGLAVIGNLSVTGGSPAWGKLLMSDDSGNASWVATSSLGISSSGSTVNTSATEYIVTGISQNVGAHDFCALGGIHYGWTTTGAATYAKVEKQANGTWLVSDDHATSDLIVQCLDIN